MDDSRINEPVDVKTQIMFYCLKNWENEWSNLIRKMGGWNVSTTNTSVSFSNLYTLNLVFKSLLSGVTNMSPLKVARTISWFCFSRGGHSLFGHDFQNVYHQRLIITDTLNQSAQVADACLNVFTCWGVGESLLKAQQARCVCVRSVLGRSPKKTSQTAFCFPCHHLWWFLSTCWNMLDKTPKG